MSEAGTLVAALDHVQLAMPVGGEPVARRFYGELLGLAEVPKPQPLRARGGVWFAGGDVCLHLGVETDFRPARKAHPGLRVRDLAMLWGRLVEAGVPVQDDDTWIGRQHFYAADPFANRLEFLAEIDAAERVSADP